ncbi:PP2C family protein-serine/threonine phosphatase [Brevibacillus fluminis]|uniref:PP2C family protein-serine/threonine phosphatase n=1 Tax=Brevibacillus fluminis TaxID=511487 RepID=UPI003F8A1AC7
MQKENLLTQYQEILQAYLQGGGENQLYLGQQLSKWLLAENVTPEEVIELHLGALSKKTEVSEEIRASFEMLTEIMIEYGNAIRENRSLRSRQKQMEAEFEIAVAMQQTMLPDEVPAFPGLDIGVVHVPANQVSGDYYNFVQREDHAFSVAIADIVGKGMPAALCMSMIKFAMDSFYESSVKPGRMLHHLNRVVERNIDPSMFVTMLFGRYDTMRHRFRYAVAGHEPGFLFCAREEKFTDLEGKGLVLGMLPETGFSEKEVALESGDMLILMTDGVIERKIGTRYFQREDLLPYLHAEIGLSAQEMADRIYRRLLLLSNFELQDDYTMIIIHRL